MIKILLERRNCVKYLGILFDPNLTWKQHILFISSRISKSFGIISRLRHFDPTDTLLSIYRSLTLCYITGNAVWDQAAQTNLGTLLILRKRTRHLIHFAPYRSHAIPLFDQYNILPLNFQYRKSACIIMQQTNRCRKTFPTYFFIQHKCIAIIVGLKRLAVLTLTIPGQIS